MGGQNHPDVIWVNTPTKLDTAEVARTIAMLDGYLRRPRPYVLLFNLGEGLPNAAQRKLLTDHMQQNAEVIVRKVMGLGVVVPSQMARSVMTAILWFAPPAIPHRLFATCPEAEIWAAMLQGRRSA